MGRVWCIGFLLLVFLSACTPKGDDEPVETRHGTPLPTTSSPELAVVDSLLWRQPDSALAVLMDFWDCRDVSRNVSENANDDTSGDVSGNVSTYDRHYANLLLAELLYKNYYAQTNRAELLEAVAYFDSLLVLAEQRGVSLQGFHHRDARHASAQHTAFLDARAHYINGVGYYELDSVVPACKEYLTALEVMEKHFEEEELVEKKARFMVLTYNRLGDMFSEQFMMEPAISCYKNSCAFSLISPISSYSVSNALYRIGKQFNMKGDLDSANYYYSQALVHIPDSTNLCYRNIVSSQTLLSYQMTHRAASSLERLKQMIVMTKDDDERLARFMVIGDIFFEEHLYDSARLYLEPVLKNKEDVVARIQAACFLHIIYDSLGDDEKSDECIHFLAQQKKSEGQNKALVSLLEDLFQKHMNLKLDQDTDKERVKAFRKAMGIIIPITIVIVLFVFGVTKLNSKKLLKEQEAVSNKMLEETKQQHRIEQAAISGRLKRSNQEVRDLKDQIKQQDEMTSKPPIAESFNDEPVCRLIMERVNEGQFKSKMDYVYYSDYALNKQQLLDLRLAADRHFGQFSVRLKKAYPRLTNADLDYCCLYLLGLTDADVAALMQRAYNTVVERNGKIRRIFGNDNPLPITLKSLANCTISA